MLLITRVLKAIQLLLIKSWTQAKIKADIIAFCQKTKKPTPHHACKKLNVVAHSLDVSCVSYSEPAEM